MAEPTKDELLSQAPHWVAEKMNSYLERNQGERYTAGDLKPWALLNIGSTLRFELGGCKYVRSNGRRTVASPDSGAPDDLDHLTNDEAIEVLEARLKACKAMEYLTHGE